MARIRFNPYWEFENLSKEFEKFFSANMRGGGRPRFYLGDFRPRVDVSEDEKGIYFDLEIPGIRKEDVKISLNEENVLLIKGEKKFPGDSAEKEEESSESEDRRCCRSERAFGRFARSFQLPKDIDGDKVEAKYQNGVLALSIPKLEPVKPKEVSIEIG